MSFGERLAWTAAGFIGGGFAFLLWLGSHAVAHENGQANWITQGDYRGGDGVHCCGPNDCEVLASDEVRVTPSGFVLIRFKETVPFSEGTPSEDGRYWRCHAYDGKRRCFFAPVGGT